MAKQVGIRSGFSREMRSAGFHNRRGSIGSSPVLLQQAQRAGVMATMENVQTDQALGILKNDYRAIHGRSVEKIEDAAKPVIDDYRIETSADSDSTKSTIRLLTVRNLGGSIVALEAEVPVVPVQQPVMEAQAIESIVFAQRELVDTAVSA